MPPIPHRPKGHVIFCVPKEETPAHEGPQRECSTSQEMGDRDLGFPPTMSPDLEQFLQTPTTGRGAGHGWSMLPKPSIENYEKWLEWQVWQLDTPTGGRN